MNYQYEHKGRTYTSNIPVTDEDIETARINFERACKEADYVIKIGPDSEMGKPGYRTVIKNDRRQLTREKR